MKYFVPILTTHAGNTLTADNWKDACVTWGACYLSALLVKPGYAFLSRLPDLRTYFSWQGYLVLNISLPKINQQQAYVLKSPYDGGLIHITREQVITLVNHLKPDCVVVSHENNELMDALSVSQRMMTEQETSYDVMENKPRCYTYLNDREAWLVSNEAPSCEDDSSKHTPLWIESDKPAQDGYEGIIYRDKTSVAITDTAYQNVFEPMDRNCQCPVCHGQLTMAYLHHLYEQTPLLCQRFLIQHNVFYYQDLLRKNNADKSL